MLKKILAAISLITLTNINVAQANIISTSNFHTFEGADIGSSQICSEFSNSTTSCNTKTYLYDTETDSYIILAAESSADVIDTSLKAKSHTNFDSGFSRDEVLLEIENSLGLDADLSDEEFFALFDKFPEFFDEEGNFLTDSYLDSIVINEPDFFSARAQASISDNWTITGGEAGEAGTLTLAYQVDGLIDSQSLEFIDGSISGGFNSARANLRLIEQQTTILDNGTQLTFAAQSDQESILSNGLFDDILELELDFIFGQSFDIQLQLSSLTGVGYQTQTSFLGVPADFYQSSDFFNTANFASLIVSDSSNVLVDYSLVSSNNLADFSRTAVTSVNEPASILILSLGLIMLLTKQRKFI